MKDQSEADQAPVVSVLMANRNGAAFLDGAIKSVLGQTLKALELIVVDDASSDGSRAIVARHAEHDARVRLIARDQAGGPASARNCALDAARGRFVAIVDADDLLHSERLARLVEHALEDKAAIVADDLMVFDAKGVRAPRRLFKGALAREPQWIDLEAFIAANHLYAQGPVLGLIKPLIARDILMSEGVRYDERLRIGEDFDLLARLLGCGFYMRLYPELTYFYRKHDASISHRLDVGALHALGENARNFIQDAASADLRARHVRRLKSIERALDYEELVTRAKSGGALSLLAHAWRRRRGLSLLRLPLLARFSRLFGRRKPEPVADVVVFSHQRVVGAVNGSSRYLIDLCSEWRRQGRRVRLVQSSPAVFGRWPLLWLSSDTDVFDAIKIRGAWAFGRLRLARSPRVWASACAALLEKALLKLGIWRKARFRAAPSALEARQGPREILFAARHGQGAGLAVADYAFLTPLLCAALNPAAPSAVIMHDLLSARRADFDARGQADSSATLSRQQEVDLLGLAKTIVAIQPDEASVVREALGERRVIVAPLAVRTIHAPSAGQANRLLFVGSNTAANCIALEWFFAEVWPRLQDRIGGRDFKLDVAGSVARGLKAPAPRGVRLLGVVKDLNPLYRSAGIVISPLTLGSGLKIKLVEAMAHAKAIVATPVTLQGVEHELREAVCVAEGAEAFAEAIHRLGLDDGARLGLARATARGVARLFAPEVCYRDLIALAGGGNRVAAPLVQHARR